MINEAVFYIKQDKVLYEYLKYHSYWYKIISRDSNRIKDMIKEMKIELKQTPEDKINDLTKKIELMGSIIDLLV